MIKEPPYLPPYKLKGGGVKMRRTYARLETTKRREVEYLLLVHAFVMNGTNVYLFWEDWNEIYRDYAYQRFREISQKIADAWLCWAQEISSARPSRLECREAILGLLSELVRV
jgi:hypothetical protein